MPRIVSEKRTQTAKRILPVQPAVSANFASACTVTVDEIVLTRKSLLNHTAAGARNAMIVRKFYRLLQPQGIINVFGMGIFMISAVGVAAAGFDADLPLAGQAMAAVVGMAIGIKSTLSA